ncbi:unnamed protein product [Clonostachys rhizophaga]|uniref:Uncharacterized protein n=1 Tax=Clonostachys rhizophaga TaxID=160324 RepID=A0A9N9UYI4_9HYPO|nr:unnamed protein product [Clonostachys rhizophaga]
MLQTETRQFINHRGSQADPAPHGGVEGKAWVAASADEALIAGHPSSGLRMAYCSLISEIRSSNAANASSMMIMGQAKGRVFVNYRIIHLEDEWKLAIDF